MSRGEVEEHVLVVDDEVDDGRSETGSSVASSSTSMRNSLLDYREENGRTYHRYKDGKYNLPNDERENDRLDMQHQMWLQALDDTTVGRVLDVGTGAGIWALNFGDEHPEATVIGNDLSAIQPGFNLEPGGNLELQEIDLLPRSDDSTLAPSSALMCWADLLVSASVKFNRPYVQIPTLVDLSKQVGFVDVSIKVFKWLSNEWPRDPKWKWLGAWQSENMLSGLEGFSMAPLTRAHGWTRAQVEVFLIDVTRNLKDRGIHAYWHSYCMYCIVGRKPREGEKPTVTAAD
ncbi:methyltransferase domain-containing protein [Colletotrichum sojae]|uniref:Methyltransferase domain-containing protein n=1 Tax=Colletotrichum sojae TaxID=2175907 RepID=A0A8H6J090_9PEZI|nr:methyltransferase domain-containing protein [Colletotrichum sojae]